MKRFLSILLAAVMIVTGVTVPKTQVMAAGNDIKAEVEIDKKNSFTEQLILNKDESGDYIYKITAKEEGIYSFSAESMRALSCQLFDDDGFNMEDKYSMLYLNAGMNEEDMPKCELAYKMAAGETVYLWITFYYGEEENTLDVEVKHNESYVEKDGIIYKEIDDPEYGSGYAVYAPVSKTEKKLTIASKMNNKNVIKILDRTFYGCEKLEEITIPEGIVCIGEKAFSYTFLKTISIPDSCKYVGDNAFESTIIAEIDIPKNVEYFGNILSMPSLTNINVAKENQKYASKDGILFSKDMKILYRFPIAKVMDLYNIPNETEEIYDYGFVNTKGINKVVCPNTLKKIGREAFSYSKICQIDLGEALEEVGAMAFESTNNLRLVDFPVTVKQMGYQCFNYCMDKTVVIRNDKCEVISQAFRPNYKNTIYANEKSSAEEVASQVDYLDFVKLNPDGCDTEQHQIVKVIDKVPTCVKDGQSTEICINCKSTFDEYIDTARGHQEYYCKNYCSACNQIIDKSKIKYLELNKDTTIAGEDFIGKTSVTQNTLYTFKATETGEYTVSYDGVYEADDTCTLTLLDYYGGDLNLSNFITKETTFSLEKDETIWISVSLFDGNNNQTIGNKIKISCEHSQTEIKTTNATCQKEGKKEEVCKICNEVVKTEVLSKVSHKYGTNNKCTMCGKLNASASKPTTKPSVTPTTKPTINKTIKVGKDTYTLDSNGQYVSKKTKKPSVSKLSKGKKSFKITWKKVSSVNGYQVQYSTSKKFTKKTTKTKTYSGNKKFTKTIKSLKSKKTYYVRVRAYKTTKVKGKNIKVYTSWSKAKSVKTK